MDRKGREGLGKRGKDNGKKKKEERVRKGNKGVDKYTQKGKNVFMQF